MSEDVMIKKTPTGDMDMKEQQAMKEVQEELRDLVDFNNVRIDDVIALTARLAQVLAEEADFLEQMQVHKIEPLQKEKVMLTNALELMKKQMHRHPEMMEEMDPQQAEDLREVVGVFNHVLEENYKRLNVARQVNQRVVQAITDVVSEQSNKESYNQKGKSNSAATQSVSVTLNEQI